MIKKDNLILFFLLLILIVIASFLPTKEITEETIDFSKNVLFLEEDEEYSMPVNISGEDALYKVVFSYSNEGIVEIEDMTLKTLEAGQTAVYASLKDNKSVISSIDVYVIEKPIITSNANELGVGETIELDFTSQEVKKDDFNWTVSDESLASIDENFVLTGLKDGKVTITATHKNSPEIISTYEVTISTPKVDYASRLVQIALNEEGYVEGANGYTKYGAWYGLTYEEWCAMFVSWSANKAGISTNIIPKFASVKAGRAFFEQQGNFELKENYTPKKGDIIFFQNGISHAAIVTGVRDGKVYTIEGNTAEKVAQRSYSLNDSLITGYGTPNY